MNLHRETRYGKKNVFEVKIKKKKPFPEHKKLLCNDSFVKSVNMIDRLSVDFFARLSNYYCA